MAKCTATAKSTGHQCRRDAITGGNVCYVHGGAAPQTKKAAERRLAEARDDALALLVQQIADGEVKPHTALKASVELSELIETLEGRVARREEHVASAPVDRELAKLADELRARADHGSAVAGSEVPVAETGPAETGDT